MYNLIQVQNRLKDLPDNPQTMQYLTAASKGQYSEIPPYAALGEMQRREAADKSKALAQGAAQGPFSTVAEQMEGKAKEKAMGLIALQQGRAQAAENLPPPLGGPTPENLPQPERQEEPVRLAQGGIARLPVDSRMFNYQQGGVIGYAGPTGSVVGDPLDEARARDEAATAKLRTYGLRQRQQDPEGYQAAVEESREAVDTIRNLERQISGGPVGAMRKPMGAGPVGQAPETAPQPTASADGENRRPTMQGDPRIIGTPAAPAPAVEKGLPGVLSKQKPSPVAQAPQVQQAPAQSDAEQFLREQMNARPAAPMTDEQIIAINAGLRPEALKTPAGSEEMKRLDAMQKQYEAGLADRGLEGLIAGLSGRAQGKGGMGSAYLATQAANRAADMAQAEAQNKMRAGIESTRRGEDTTEFGRRTGIRTAEQTQRETASKGRTDIAAGLFKEEQDILGKQIMANAQVRASQISAAARDASGGNTSALRAIEDADKAYKIDAQRIFAKMEQPLYLNTRDPVRLQELKDMETQLETIRKNAYARYGVPYIAPAAPGDNKEIKRPPGLTEALMQYLRPTK